MNIELNDRLLVETQQLANRFNRLNTFMHSKMFNTLSRSEKDLMYKQQRAMSKYLQILGQRLSSRGVTFVNDPDQ